jgi:hypothetical protein
MRCLKRDVGYRSATGDWREVQANKAMAALMMPRALFTQVALAHPGLHAVRANAVADPATGEVVCDLARSFEVSKQAAAILIGTLKIIPGGSTFDFTNLADPGLED